MLTLILAAWFMWKTVKEVDCKIKWNRVHLWNFFAVSINHSLVQSHAIMFRCVVQAFGSLRKLFAQCLLKSFHQFSREHLAKDMIYIIKILKKMSHELKYYILQPFFLLDSDWFFQYSLKHSEWTFEKEWIITSFDMVISSFSNTVFQMILDL